MAADSGATAVVLATPYYFPAGQTELLAYVQRLTAELPLPLMLYNMPSLTKVWFDVDTLAKLTAIDSILGIKDSSGDLEYFHSLMGLRAQRPDWSILIGPEAMICEAMELGGDGGVCGGANVLPELFVGCYQAVVRGDRAEAERLRSQIVAFQEIYTIGKYASRFIKATKSACRCGASAATCWPSHSIISCRRSVPGTQCIEPVRGGRQTGNLIGVTPTRRPANRC